jgi:hypothetical protein
LLRISSKIFGRSDVSEKAVTHDETSNEKEIAMVLNGEV